MVLFGMCSRLPSLPFCSGFRMFQGPYSSPSSVTWHIVSSLLCPITPTRLKTRMWRTISTCCTLSCSCWCMRILLCEKRQLWPWCALWSQICSCWISLHPTASTASPLKVASQTPAIPLAWTTITPDSARCCATSTFALLKKSAPLTLVSPSPGLWMLFHVVVFTFLLLLAQGRISVLSAIGNLLCQIDVCDPNLSLSLYLPQSFSLSLSIYLSPWFCECGAESVSPHSHHHPAEIRASFCCLGNVSCLPCWRLAGSHNGDNRTIRLVLVE